MSAPRRARHLSGKPVFFLWIPIDTPNSAANQRRSPDKCGEKDIHFSNAGVSQRRTHRLQPDYL